MFIFFKTSDYPPRSFIFLDKDNMAKKSNEIIKAESRGLYGTIAEELANSERYFSDDAEKILKFHGMYQQEDRDARKRDRTADHHQFMIRSKMPGGQLTATQYLAHDAIADEFGSGTLRLTTREAIQLHGVLKDDIRDTLRRLNHALVT
ncbi:MAG: hypothetical protein F9K46_16555, partial [Anaerolineae bacterium]